MQEAPSDVKTQQAALLREIQAYASLNDYVFSEDYFREKIKREWDTWTAIVEEERPKKTRGSLKYRLACKRMEAASLLKPYFLTYFYGLVELRALIDEDKKRFSAEQLNLASKVILQQEQAKMQMALERYKSGQLTLAEVRDKSFQRTVLQHNPPDKYGEDDINVLHDIVGTVEGGRGNFPHYYSMSLIDSSSQLKAAQWFCTQSCKLSISNLCSEKNFRALYSSAVKGKATVTFYDVKVFFNTILEETKEQKRVRVIYRADGDAFELSSSVDVGRHLWLQGTDRVKLPSYQAVIFTFAQSGEFALSLTRGAFDASLNLAIPTLKTLTVGGQLTSAHLDCLRKIPEGLLKKLLLTECEFESQAVRDEYFAFVANQTQTDVHFGDGSVHKEYLAFQEKREAAEAYLKAMVTRVEDSENDLQLEEFTPANCAAILRLGEQKDSALGKKHAFKKLHAIASMMVRKLIVIADDSTLQGALWFIRNSESPEQVVVNGLQNERYFSLLCQEMTDPAKRACLRFGHMRVSVEAVGEYLALGHAAVHYFAEEKNFYLTPLQSASEKSGASVLLFHGAFELETLKHCVGAVKGKVELRFSKHTFSPEDVEYLSSFSFENIGSVDFDVCEFTPEVRARFFESGQKILGRVPHTAVIKKEYLEYMEQLVKIQRVQTLIGRYKNNTLKASELMAEAVEKFSTAGLSAEEIEIVADLIQIREFPLHREVVISDDRMFRAAQWLMACGGFPKVRARNIEEIKGLIAAYEQNEHPLVDLGLSVVLSESCELRICSFNILLGRVNVLLKGKLDEASEVLFNQVVNSIRKPCGILLDDTNFHAELDLSNPAIEAITLTSQKITARHVDMLRVATHLKSFKATGCSFDSPVTKIDFVTAVLANPNLVELELFGCELTQIHLGEMYDYLLAHPALTSVNVGGNPFRDGQDEQLQAALQANQKRFKAEQDRKAAHEKLLWRAKNMPFDDKAKFLKELEKLLEEHGAQQEMIACIVAGAVVAHKRGTLAPAVLGTLLQPKYTNAELEQCRIECVEKLAKRCVSIENLNEFKATVETIIDLVPRGSSKHLFKLMYESFVRLAFFYVYQHGKDAWAEDQILRYLKCIPVVEEEHYASAVTFTKKIFLYKVSRILSGNNPTMLEQLGKLCSDEKKSLQDMVQTVYEECEKNTTTLPLVKVKFKKDWVEKCEILCSDMMPYLPVPEASAPPKGEVMKNEFTKDLPEVEQVTSVEESKGEKAKVAMASINPPVITPPIGEPFRLNREEAPLAVAPALSNEPPVRAPEYQAPAQGFVPPPTSDSGGAQLGVVAPVAYPPPVPVAQLVNNQRRAEAVPPLAPVPQAVAPAAPQPEKAFTKRIPTKRVATTE